MNDGQYYVYILTHKTNRVLYTGVTNNIARRVYEHREKIVPGFTRKYNVTKLVYDETFDSPTDAITREQQIQGGSKLKKLKLISTINPDWKDLSEKIG